MSEQIKYEHLWGDSELFKHAPVDAVVAVQYANGIDYYSESYPSLGVIYTSEVSIAMRRIISTPVWTKADQEAGRLPLIGAKYEIEGCIVEHLGNGAAGYQNIFNFRYPSGACGKAHERLAKPIETPEERANRLRKEWVDSVRDITPVNEDVSMFMLTVQQNQTQLIYDALLSGELKMPEVQK